MAIKTPLWVLAVSSALLITSIGWKVHQPDALEQYDSNVQGSQLADLIDSPLMYAKVGSSNHIHVPEKWEIEIKHSSDHNTRR